MALAFTVLSSAPGAPASRPTARRRRERRGVGNIITNSLVGTAGAALALWSLWGAKLAAVWFVAGTGAGASDTVASGDGQSLGRAAAIVPFVAARGTGTPGAVSVAATIAGMMAAL